MLRILAIGTDRSLLDPTSFAFTRQERYYQDLKVDILLLCSGPATEATKGNIRVMTAGGKNKVHTLVRTLALVRRLIARHKYDLVSVQDPLWSGLVGHVAVFGSSIPLYLQDHSGFFGRKPFSWIERIFARYSWLLARRATRIRVVSKRSKDGLIRRGIAADRIDQIPVYCSLTGVATRVHRTTPTTLFSVGRLEREKGYEACLRAWALLPELEGVFVIAGDGSERPVYERLCQELGIASRVRFVGFQKQLDPFWLEADVYIQPSFFEGWARAIHEAAAWHLPIATSPIGAGDILMPDASVLLFEPGNPVSIAAVIKRLWSDADLRIRLGEAAFQAVRSQAPSEEVLVEAVRTSLARAAQKM